MKQIHSVNSITVPYPAQKVWNTISDISSYASWWPSTVKIKVLHAAPSLIGSQVEIRPYGGVPFYCEFFESVDHVKLVMKYSGIYTGLGIWTLSEMNDGTKVDYEINLEINSVFIRLLAYVVPVEKIHFRLMNEVLSGLEKRLERTT